MFEVSTKTCTFHPGVWTRYFSNTPCRQLVITQLAHTTCHHTTCSHTTLLTHLVVNLSSHNLYLRFTWQAWHVWHWAGSGGTLGPEWDAGTLRLLAWQAWHLATCTLVPRGRRGTRWHRPLLSFPWQAWYLVTSDCQLLKVPLKAMWMKHKWNGWFYDLFRGFNHLQVEISPCHFISRNELRRRIHAMWMQPKKYMFKNDPFWSSAWFVFCGRDVWFTRKEGAKR